MHNCYVHDYTKNFWMDEANYYPDSIIQEDFDKAYAEHELLEQIDAIESEMATRRQERIFQIERIAKEAHSKKIPFNRIFKFFQIYDFSERDKLMFWQYYSE